MASTFDRAMQMMRQHNPQTQEDGFALLRPVAVDHLPELIEAFETEQDHGLKCWLLELIGLARSEGAFSVLERELSNDDESLRDWAVLGLRQLNNKQARAALWERGFST
ncbi:MAG: HEAT repeat domain-containing protein [Sporichthyaceae bacterium]